MDRPNQMPTSSAFPDPRLAYSNTSPTSMMPYIPQSQAINLQQYNNQWCLICQTGSSSEEPQMLNIHFTWATKSKSNMMGVMSNLVQPWILKLQVKLNFNSFAL